MITVLALSFSLSTAAFAAPTQTGQLLAQRSAIKAGDLELLTAKQSALRSPAAPARAGTMPPDIQQILDRGKLVVALLNQANPPFFLTDLAEPDQLTGLDVELAQAIAEQLGVRVEFNRSAQTFDGVIKTVYDSEADLAISKLSRTLSRAKSIRFSRPYLNMRQGLLVNRLQIAQQSNGRSTAEIIRNLQGKVGVIRGSSYASFVRKRFPRATVIEFPTWAEAVTAVSQGEILAAYRDELEIKKTIFSQPNRALTLQTIALTDTQDSIAIALPWKSQHLLAFVDQYLETFGVDYTADRVLQEYAGMLVD